MPISVCLFSCAVHAHHAADVPHSASLLPPQQRLKPLKQSPTSARAKLPRVANGRAPLAVRAGLAFGSARRALALSAGGGGGGGGGYSIGSNVAGESYVERAIERGLSYASRAKTLAPAGTPVAEMADAIISELEEARTLRQSLLDGEGENGPERCAGSSGDDRTRLLAAAGSSLLPSLRATRAPSSPVRADACSRTNFLRLRLPTPR